jgi:pilus assembly protein Flp/PilA
VQHRVLYLIDFQRSSIVLKIFEKIECFGAPCLQTPWLEVLYGGETPPYREFCHMSTLKRFLRDQSGATAIEYGLIAAGISIAIVVVVKGVGSSLNTTFTSVQNALNTK